MHFFLSLLFLLLLFRRRFESSIAILLVDCINLFICYVTIAVRLPCGMGKRHLFRSYAVRLAPKTKQNEKKIIVYSNFPWKIDFRLRLFVKFMIFHEYEWMAVVYRSHCARHFCARSDGLMIGVQNGWPSRLNWKALKFVVISRVICNYRDLMLSGCIVDGRCSILWHCDATTATLNARRCSIHGKY